MDKLKNGQRKPIVKTRNFYVCTMGKNPNGSHSFNTFDIVTKNGHPTIRRCIELSNERYPNQREVILISISELNHADWKRFVSEQ